MKGPIYTVPLEKTSIEDSTLQGAYLIKNIARKLDTWFKTSKNSVSLKAPHSSCIDFMVLYVIVNWVLCWITLWITTFWVIVDKDVQPWSLSKLLSIISSIRQLYLKMLGTNTWGCFFSCETGTPLETKCPHELLFISQKMCFHLIWEFASCSSV